jgi:copper homeostasis protein
LELCASLLEGGLSPSPGVVRAATASVRMPVHAMVRPRGGDFLYSDLEFASMLDDIAAHRQAGAAGVVFGCLRDDGTVDEDRTRALVDRARPLGTTFHRAFDMTRDAAASLEALIRCGVDRVLTSGQAPTAIEGLDTLKLLAAQAAGRIVVMPCGDLGPATIGTVRRETGLTEFHFAALRAAPSPMRWRNPRIGMGGTELDREYMLTVTDPDLIRATIAAARDSAIR